MMKRRIYISVVLMLSGLLAGCSQYKVYSVKDSPSLPVSGGVLYALPKTQLCVSVTVERRDMSRAPYSQYASDYLGVEPYDVDTNYRLVGIDVDGVNVADPNNYYFIRVNRGTVTVDDRHLLLAVGKPNPADNTMTSSAPEGPASAKSRNGASRGPVASYNLYDRVDTFYSRYDTPERPTMRLSRKDVRSAKQRAAAAAERLEEIQQKRQELIDGDYEGTYSADAVQYLYAQLQRQEADIVASFCGEVKSETVRFYVEPQKLRYGDFCDTLIWFSPEAGFVGDAEHLPADAFPIVCMVHINSDMNTVNRFVKYHTSGYTQSGSSGRTGRAAAKYRNRKGFRYRIPAMATVEVSTPVFALSRQLALSQLGPVVELPNRRIKAVFDVKTLDLREIDRR